MRPPSTTDKAGTFFVGCGLIGFCLTALIAFMAALSGETELWRWAEHTIVPNALLLTVGAVLVIVGSGSRRRYGQGGDSE